MRILVVEDDSTIASYIVSGLREVGFAVDCAEDGESGLDLALTEPYDVAIIDNLSTGKKQNLNPKARFYQVDLRNADAVAQVFEKEKPTQTVWVLL